jgi:hypothetical protein
MNRNTKTIITWTPSGIITLLLVLSGVSKIAGQSPMIAHFKEMQLDSFTPLFGAMEIAFALCFILKRTMKAGLLLLTAYFGGAMAVELPYGTYAIVPLVLLAFIWVAAFVRRKEMFLTSTDAKHTALSL